MGYRIANPEQAVQMIEELSGRETLLCLYLFDDRQSNRRLLERLSQQFAFIDSLSYQCDVLSLLMASSFTDTIDAPLWAGMERLLRTDEAALLEVLDRETVYVNPSPIFAKSFDIGPGSLPGILFIPAVTEPEAPVHGQYLPIRVPDESESSIEIYLENLYEGLRNILAVRTVRDLSTDDYRSLPNGKSVFATKAVTLAQVMDEARKAVSNTREIRTRLRNDRYMPVAERGCANIFVSYASQDRLSARAICERLREVGFAPWIDVVNLVPGEQWERAIEEALREADFFVACLSTNSVAKRGYIQREFKRAMEIWEEKLASDIFVIPLRLDDCNVPQSLRRFQWVDWADGAGLPALVSAVTEGMRRLGKYSG